MTQTEKTIEDALSSNQADQPHPLKRHTSRLPNWLYLLSFAPPCPSPTRNPKEFIQHPIVMFCIGVPAAIISGVGMPAFDIMVGQWSNRIRAPGATPDQIMEAGSWAGWIMTIVAVAFALTFTLFYICFTMAGAKLSNSLREQYLAAIIVQDQAFFDRIGPGEIVTRASKDINVIRTGLGERLGYLIWSLSIMLVSFISAFVNAPRLAGVLLALVVLTMILFTLLGFVTEKVSKTVDIVDGKASTLIEQILSSVRVVQSFNMAGPLLLKLENDFLRPLRKLSRKRSWTKAVEMASAYGAGFMVYSCTFWYGGIEVSRGTSVGNVLTAFYNYVGIFFTFAGVVPHLLAMTQAVHAIGNLRLQIERQPPIDVRDPSGLKLSDKVGFEPSFELDGVTFAYPARPSQKALDDVTMKIDAGKFTALVGPSGSGKSTLASLLLRLYDPATSSKLTVEDRKVIENFRRNAEQDDIDEDILVEEYKRIKGQGIIKFAGKDAREYNVKWLRSQVAVVLQNPQLVSGTVFDNVAVGLTGSELEYRPSSEEEVLDRQDKLKKQLVEDRVEEALRKAQAWDFVQQLPEGLQTKVSGGRTGVLSGGQVQRVALARALVRRPRCLLLDEATSAVSADTEMRIQEALIQEQKERGMTLIVIAHRLSTIVAADKIFVMVGGQPKYSGTYEELMDPECPDQTFRNMALVKQSDIEVPKEELRPLRPTSSGKLSSAVSRKDGKDEQLPEIDPEERVRPLPPPMKKTKEAFQHTWMLFSMGIVLGIAGGGAWVVASWLHGRGVSALGIPDLALMRETVNRWSLWFLILTIGTFIDIVLHSFGLEYSGERIVSEYRRESVRALVKQEVSYFETESKGSGSLTAAATYHPSNIGNVIGIVMAQFLAATSNFTGVVIMVFIINWRLAVMILPALAMTTAFGYANFYCQEIFEKSINDDIENQSNFVAEAANSIQMLAALTREAETVRQFNEKFTKTPIKSKWLVGSGASLGISQGVLQGFGALIFWWGARLLANGLTNIADLFTVIEAVIVAVFVCAKVFTYTGDFARMKTSLGIIQGWLTREPDLAVIPATGPSTPNEKNSGIEFKDVSLRYPTRQDVLALKEVSFRMELGKSYAFCGTSGAGKSTILAVLQRFYDISNGAVYLDGRDLREMTADEVRRQMGYVSQEPILFEETVRWNLIYGALDPNSVTQEEIEWACKQACIYDFIQTLPDGFDTDLGLKGGQLSGGQRQRLCIARALLRKPKILLLDEATSALDGKSEAHVQQALDNASKGRLTITIAHRLSTIRKADTIFVMEQGKIIEVGNHEELLERKGRYLELVQAQL